VVAGATHTSPAMIDAAASRPAAARVNERTPQPMPATYQGATGSRNGGLSDAHFRVADRAESIKSAAIDDAYLHS
jgi:hypothetical protein